MATSYRCKHCEDRVYQLPNGGGWRHLAPVAGLRTRHEPEPRDEPEQETPQGSWGRV